MAIINGTAGDDLLPGTRFADDIRGFTGNDTVRAGAGDDYVLGDSGNDLLYGDSGDDWLVGGSGVDTFFGGTGFDAASFVADPTGSGGGVTLDLSRTFPGVGGERYALATVRTLGLTYQERLYGIEDVLGSLGADSITGSVGSNILLGDRGNDTLSGGGGNDTVSGEVGNDSLSGGAGSDVVDGGAGADRLDGGVGFNEIVTGAGADTIVFRGDGRSDDLVDFDVRLDTLLIAGTGSPPGATFTQLVNNGTIAVYDNGVDTILEYRGSDVVLFGIDPGWLNNGNVLIA